MAMATDNVATDTEYPDYAPDAAPTSQYREGLQISPAPPSELPIGPPPSSGLPITQPAPPAGASPWAGLPLPPMPQPAPWSTVGGIGNILQSFGAGTQGRTPDWMILDAQQRQQAVQQYDLALKLQEAQRQQQVTAATIPHIQSQTQLYQQQAQKAALETLDHARLIVGDPTLTDEQRSQYIESLTPMLSRQLSAASAGDPTAQRMAGDPDFIKAILRGGASAIDSFMASYPLLNANDRATVGQYVLARNYDKAIEVATTLSTQNRDQILAPLGQRVLRYLESRAAAAPGKPQPPLTIDDALTLVGASKIERAAVDHMMTHGKADEVSAMLARYGIASPYTQAKAQEKYTTELAGEQTPGGQAKIAETQAGTRLKQAQTAKEPYMQVPGQGGAVIQLPGVGGPTSPAGPAGGVIYQAPYGPASPQVAQQLTQAEIALNSARNLQTLTKNGAMDRYIGPNAGRLRAEWAARGPGQGDPRLGQMQQFEGELRSQVDRATEQGSVRPVEKQDLMKISPDHTTDKPAPYQAKLDYLVRVLEVVNQRNHELLTPDGQRRIGVNPEDVYRRYPLPQPAGDVTGRPTSQIQGPAFAPER